MFVYSHSEASFHAPQIVSLSRFQPMVCLMGFPHFFTPMFASLVGQLFSVDVSCSTVYITTRIPQSRLIKLPKV